MSVKEIKDKVTWLWEDERRYINRAGLAALPTFTLAFMLLFFGPMDIIVGNDQYFAGSFEQFFLPYAIITAVVFWAWSC